MSVSIAWGDPISGISGSCSPSWVCSPETVDFRQIGGWEYSRLVLLGVERTIRPAGIPHAATHPSGASIAATSRRRGRGMLLWAIGFVTSS